MLWTRLRPKKTEETGVRFSHNTEFTILLVVCLILAVIGSSLALKGSVAGWILGILGVGGISAILVFSILSQAGAKPSYDAFLAGPFFFLVFLGLSIGIYIGKVEYSFSWGLLSGALGVFLGYVFGIFAGLWFQYLGWVASIVDMLLGLAIIGMMIVDLVLLFK